jgi:predicted permease
MLQDLRFAIRSLARRKALLFLAVTTLGLGIGVTTTLFSIVNGVLLRPLPYASPDRLAILWHQFGRGAQDLPNMHPLDYRDYRDRSRTLDALTIATGQQWVLGGADRPQIVQVGTVAADFFRFFGVEPLLGRHFTAAEDVPGGPRVAILSHRLWQTRYGGDPSIVGRTVDLNSQRVEIVGVLPAGFRLDIPAETYALRDADIWRPAQINFGQQPPRNLTAYTVFARLAPGVTFTQAQQELDGIAAQLRQEVPVHLASDLRVKVVPLLHDVVKGARGGLWMLMTAVTVVLAIACVNVALLMLARARERDRELLVRIAVGAGRWRIVRLLLIESLIVAAAGGAAGVLVAELALAATSSSAITPALSKVPRLADVTLDVTVLAFVAAVSTLSAIVFGLLPALKASRVDVSDALRAAAVGSRSRQASRGRDLLIVLQLALGLIVVAASGLVVQSFRALAEAHPGFDTRETFTARVSTPAGPTFANRAAAQAYHADIRRQLMALPGVAAAGAISQLPLTGQGPLQPYAYDAETARNWESVSADNFQVTPGYFDAVRATWLAGRDITDDEGASARRVIVIDDTLAARAYGGATNAIGKLLQLEPEGTPESFYEVVGVVRHMRYHDLRRPMLPQIYRAGLFRTYSLAIRTGATGTTGTTATTGATGTTRPTGTASTTGTTADLQALAGAMRQTLSASRAGTAVQDVRPLAALVDDALGPMRVAGWVMTGFGLLALTLAAVGIYGVFSNYVGERTREIALRLTLGATPAGVRQLVVRRALTLTAAGLAIGLIGTAMMNAAASRLLFATDGLAIATWTVAAAIVCAVAVASSWLPAHRASRIDPQQGLRLL